MNSLNDGDKHNAKVIFEMLKMEDLGNNLESEKIIDLITIVIILNQKGITTSQFENNNKLFISLFIQCDFVVNENNINYIFDKMNGLHYPFVIVKYNNESHKFYSQIEYDNWLKTIPDSENISNITYYKGLGIHDTI